jgi:hypothetical protein
VHDAVERGNKELGIADQETSNQPPATSNRKRYATNRTVRLLDIFCRLKAWAGQSGLIRDHRTKWQQMISLCTCSINKLKPAIKELQRMGWLYVDDHCIKLHAWQTVYEKCELDYNKKIDRIFTKPNRLENEQQTHYWLYLADIEDNRKRQAHTVLQFYLQNSHIKLWLYGIIQQSGTTIADAEKDPSKLLVILQNEYLKSFHSRESEMHSTLVEHRPDVNRSVHGMAYAWNTLPMNVCYVKKKLQSQKLAFVQKIGTIASPGWSRNKFAHQRHTQDGVKPMGVMWNKVRKVTFQSFCDDIVARKDFGGNDWANVVNAPTDRGRVAA